MDPEQAEQLAAVAQEDCDMALSHDVRQVRCERSPSPDGDPIPPTAQAVGFMRRLL